jgi:hypothetical protein
MIDEIIIVERMVLNDDKRESCVRGRITHLPSGRFIQWICERDGWDSVKENKLRRLLGYCAGQSFGGRRTEIK